jgi:hypothetical protein
MMMKGDEKEKVSVDIIQNTLLCILLMVAELLPTVAVAVVLRMPAVVVVPMSEQGHIPVKEPLLRLMQPLSGISNWPGLQEQLVRVVDEEGTLIQGLIWTRLHRSPI